MQSFIDPDSSWLILAYLVGAYLIGSIPFGVMLSPPTDDGKNILERGSGNPGAANVWRHSGPKIALLVLACDVFKGWLPIFLADKIGFPPILVSLIGTLVVLGHVKSIFIGFKGGKGVATSLGIIIAIDWRVAIICFCLWLGILLWTRYSSLGSLCGVLFAPILALVLKDNLIFIVFFSILTVAIFVLHKENIKRLINGEENQLNIFRGKE